MDDAHETTEKHRRQDKKRSSQDLFRVRERTDE